MSMIEIGSLVVTLSVLIMLVHVLGYLFEQLRQPRLVGEILAGVIIGPFVLGRFSPAIATELFGEPANTNKIQIVLNFFTGSACFF